MPIPVFLHESIVQRESQCQGEVETYLPGFNVRINPLTLNLKTLLDGKDTRVSQISNDSQNAKLALNELIHDGELKIEISHTWIEVAFKALLVLQGALILAVLIM